MSELCTLHQVIQSNGLPRVQGSEVRLPSGEVIPHVVAVRTEAVCGQQYWETTITLRTLFGDPIHHQLMTTELPMWPKSPADG